MSKYYTFDKKAIANALEAAANTHKGSQLKATESEFNITKGGDLLVAAECVAITVENNKVCIDLPLGLGKHCLNLPVSIPNGTAGKACLSICTTWGIPTGVKVSVVIAGITVVSQTFGKC